MTLETYLVAALAVVLTGISKSGFAGGLGILGVPLVALTMSPQAAAVLLLPILIGIDILSVWRYRRAWQIRIIVALLPGAALGIGLGMMGYSRIDPDLLRVAIGIMALCFVLRFRLGEETCRSARTLHGLRSLLPAPRPALRVSWPMPEVRRSRALCCGQVSTSLPSLERTRFSSSC